MLKKKCFVESKNRFKNCILKFTLLGTIKKLIQKYDMFLPLPTISRGLFEKVRLVKNDFASCVLYNLVHSKRQSFVWKY